VDSQFNPAYDRLTGRLVDVTGYTAPRAGADWCCPAHDDNSPSLSVTAADGCVLVHCQAGCDRAAVLAALGMTDSDLFDEPLTNGNGKSTSGIDPELWTPYGEAVAIYDYTDENGRTLFQVCRTAAKEFPVRVPDATKKGGYRWKWGETRRVIYRLAAVRQAVAEGWRVWIVEGEKDVHALERVGEVATCNPGGAGKWRPEYCEWLRDANVVIVADNDPVGARHARRTSAMLRGIAKSVSVVQALTGKDAADHMNAGHSIDEFVPFIGPNNESDDEAEPNTAAPEPAALARLRPQFIGTQEVLDMPAPEWLLDGVLVKNSLVVIWGAPGSAKSFLALDWALCVASGTWWKGHKVEAAPVVYMAAEGVAGLGKRIKAWSSANNVRGLDRARWLAGTVNLLNPAEAGALFTLVGEFSPRLIIVDTLARSMAGADENAAQDMGRAIAVLDELRAVSDATVLVIHHATKEGSSARGSSALRGAVDTEIEVKKEGHDVSVFCRKQKDAELFTGISLRLVVEQPSCVLHHLQIGHANHRSLSGVLASVKVMFHESFGESGASAAELRKATMETLGVSEAMYYRIRNALLTEGFMVNKGTGRYPFFEPGENYVNVDDLQTFKSLATHLQDDPNLLATTLPPLRGGGLQVRGESESESDSETDSESESDEDDQGGFF
jgi:5S rRNA maturation endonuclease (ribonuclease M5)